MDYVICQICREKLSFSQHCPCSLGEHLIQKHPEVHMTHFSIQSNVCCCRCDKGMSLQKNFQGCPAGKMGGDPSKCSRSSDTKSGVFKTTVETWKPGPLRVLCPVCNNTDRPCIRKQRNKVAYSSLGALCTLSCWPLCFLPFLMPQGSTIHLYCRHCGTFLGEYNRKTGTLTTCCKDSTRKIIVPSDLC